MRGEVMELVVSSSESCLWARAAMTRIIYLGEGVGWGGRAMDVRYIISTRTIFE